MKVSRGLISLSIFLIVIGCMYSIFGVSEGFKAVMSGERCGVDMTSCPTNKKCMNGVCYTTGTPCLPKNELDVYP